MSTYPTKWSTIHQLWVYIKSVNKKSEAARPSEHLPYQMSNINNRPSLRADVNTCKYCSSKRSTLPIEPQPILTIQICPTKWVTDLPNELLHTALPIEYLPYPLNQSPTYRMAPIILQKHFINDDSSYGEDIIKWKVWSRQISPCPMTSLSLYDNGTWIYRELIMLATLTVITTQSTSHNGSKKKNTKQTGSTYSQH